MSTRLTSRSSSWGGLKRIAGDNAGHVVKREPRTDIRGVALLMQKNRLILNRETNESIPCRVTQVSENGCRLGLPPGRAFPDCVVVDAQFVLEVEKQGGWLVEVRWFNTTQCGMKKIRKL